MKHASLFSGIGGFDLAAEWMGWENIFAVEKDPDCHKVLKKNFPDINIYEDIKEFKGEKYKGSIDIISGGFPCQPFSVAGKQKSKKDDRYLWPQMLRVIREIQPTWVVGENVPGIISLALDQVLSDLENEGYTCQAFVIPACAVNAVHRRDRVWILANSKCIGRKTKIGIQNKCKPIQQEFKYASKIQHAPDSQHDGSLASEIGGEISNHAREGEKGSEQLLESERENSSRESNGLHQERTSQHSHVNINRTIPRTHREADQISGEHREEILLSREFSGTDNNASKPNQRRKRLSYPVSQPTICRGNDGISYRLDDGRLITRKQRNNSLKQLGNSVVPQLVYEIFRIIEELR